MSDVHLFHTADGGEITVELGQVSMSEGLETSVYLSWFGGNERDTGLPSTERDQWWGNLDENEPARRYRSETQALLASIPLIPANRRRIEEAAARDIAWMVGTVAISATVTVTLPAPDTVNLSAVIIVGDERFPITVPYTRTS